MANREWTVRVVNFRDTKTHLPGLWVEQLRYMGFAKDLADFEDRNVIEFYAPRSVNGQVWAEQNADRMCSFGINAVAAPKWGLGTDKPFTADGTSKRV